MTMTKQHSGLWHLYNALCARILLQAVADAIVRRWQWIVLLVIFFYKIIDFESVAAPIIFIMRDGDGDVVSLAALLGIATAWSAWNSETLSRGTFGQFLSSLPIPLAMRWRADLLMLLVVNNLVWIPFVVALIIIPYLNLPAYSLPLQIANLVLALLGILVVQIYWHYRRRVLAIACSGVLLACTYADRILDSQLQLALTVFVVGLALYAVLCPDWLYRKGDIAWRGRDVSYFLQVLNRAGAFNWLPISLIVQWRILRENAFLLLVVFMLAASFTVFMMMVIFFGEKYESAPGFSVFASGVVALVVSSLFRPLLAAHRQSLSYENTLPQASGFWFRKDCLFVSVILSIILAPLWFSLYAAALLSPGGLLTTAAGAILLLVVLRITMTIFVRQWVLAATIVTAMFIYIFGGLVV